MQHYLIYTTLTAWNEPPRSRHQITAGLQERGKVYFVERSRVGLPKVEVNELAKNVVVITPYFPVDYRIRYRTPLLNEGYHYWLLSAIKELGVQFEIVFTFDHTSHLIHRFYDNVVYYCGDDFVGNSAYSLFLINYFHRAIEKKLATRSRMCVVTSEFLLNKHRQYNKSTYLVPLGSPTIQAEQLQLHKKPAHHLPTLGIVAFFNFKIPLEVLDELLAVYKVYLIGPSDQQFRNRYQHHNNAILTGPKTGNELYTLLANDVDVCIAPYAEDRINKGVTPNKLWLYMALGKPCVVTDIPNIKGWDFDEGVLYKCKNQAFGQLCKVAFEEDNEVLFSKRISIAAGNSWEKRVDSILATYYLH